MSLTITTGANSHVPLLQLLVDALSEGINPDTKPGAKDAEPLPGGSLTWQAWREKYGGGVVDKPLAPHHEETWNWFDSLVQGVKPPALIQCWSRGHGKSTTVETNVSRLCAKATRRFVVYVSGTQEAADRHVQSIAELLESQGVERAVNKYGFSRGWKGNLLRTANGFNVLAFGLDAGARGVKLGALRPDVLVFDDIDERHDSIDVAAKKTETISQTVLPAGSVDCAVIFVQNEIHSYSVMAQSLSRENGILLRRIPTEKIPAVRNLTYIKVPDEHGQEVYKVTGGEPTWSGKDIAVCELEINEFGLISFMRECQHDTGLGTTFFDDFDKERHVVTPLFTPDEGLPLWWNKFGGLDWGWNDPFAFGLFATDELGAVHAIESFQESKLTNDEQAAKVCALLKKWNVAKDTCMIAYDPSMDNKHHARQAPGVVGEADIEAFHRAGLTCVPADNNRQAGFSHIRAFLRHLASDKLPFLRIWRGYNVDLCRFFPLATYSKTNAEDMAEGPWDHLLDILRYMIRLRPELSKSPDSMPPKQHKRIFPGAPKTDQSGSRR